MARLAIANETGMNQSNHSIQCPEWGVKTVFFTKLAVFMLVQTVFKQTIFRNPSWCPKLNLLFSCWISGFWLKRRPKHAKANFHLQEEFSKKNESFHLANLLFQETGMKTANLVKNTVSPQIPDTVMNIEYVYARETWKHW